MDTKKQHWETVYTTKTANEVSWTQEVPHTSLDFVHEFNLPKTAKIIDIGGGDSRLVDYLLKEGYENLTVLDISEKSLEKAKERLGQAANKVKWIVSDILEFQPQEQYDLWHDRATFHFLTTVEQVEDYLDIAGSAAQQFLVVGTFAENGPEKCSGLEVHRYSEDDLTHAFRRQFSKRRCISAQHQTPFKTIQHFTFCSFDRKMPQNTTN
ncbi:MAG TPA: class I SAM-dependent methyltransferase [Saprospiraceae bacterium]|nr:class I SAM-dependent methyltransferase [Saprospiraceae bacterium]